MGAYSTASLLRTVNDILDFSKLESNKLTLELSGFSPKALLMEVIHYAQIISESKKLTITPALDELIDVPLQGDKNGIKQILDNLVNNAVKFTQTGTVTIGARVSKQDDGFELVCWVNDSGIGISEEDQTRLFQPFSQVNMQQQQAQTGTGLGLSICRELVNLMHGSIDMRSKTDQGTQLQVSIPLQKAQKLELSQQGSFGFDVSTLQGTRILLVEDNDINQQITRAQLQVQGLDCDIANNGQECLQQLQDSEFKYDIILMDIQMPILDGYSAAKMIREGKAGEKHQHVPIIALTAHVSLEEQQKAHEAGMKRHINKPVDPVQLIGEIFRQVGGME